MTLRMTFTKRTYRRAAGDGLQFAGGGHRCADPHEVLIYPTVYY